MENDEGGADQRMEVVVQGKVAVAQKKEAVVLQRREEETAVHEGSQDMHPGPEMETFCFRDTVW